MAKSKDSFKIPLPIYGTEVEVYLTREAYAKATGDDQQSSPEVSDGCTMIKGYHAYVGLFDISHGVIAHEMFHATANILGTRGISLTDASEEAYTYLLGHLVDETYKRLDKLKDKHNDRQLEDSTAA